jgi:hypothetical protein
VHGSRTAFIQAEDKAEAGHEGADTIASNAGFGNSAGLHHLKKGSRALLPKGSPGLRNEIL